MRISDWSSDVCAAGSSARAHKTRHWQRCCFCIGRCSLSSCHGSKTSRAPSNGNASPLCCLNRKCSGYCATSAASRADRKSVVEGKSVSVRVDLGGRRIIKTKKKEERVLEVYKRK